MDADNRMIFFLTKILTKYSILRLKIIIFPHYFLMKSYP